MICILSVILLQKTLPWKVSRFLMQGRVLRLKKLPNLFLNILFVSVSVWLLRKPESDGNVDTQRIPHMQGLQVCKKGDKNQDFDSQPDTLRNDFLKSVFNGITKQKKISFGQIFLEMCINCKYVLQRYVYVQTQN